MFAFKINKSGTINNNMLLDSLMLAALVNVTETK